MRFLATVLITLAPAMAFCDAEEPESIHVSETVEFFKWFESEGIYSSKVSDESVRKILAVGLFSREPEIVARTISALILFSGAHLLRSYPDFDPSIPFLIDRTSIGIPKMKEFLKHYYRSQGGRDRTSRTIELEILDYDRLWRGVPRVLAHVYQKDSEVLEFIWEVEASPEFGREYTLELLNAGKFESPRANAYRIETLSLASSDAPIVEAALGLARHQSPEGLQALVARLDWVDTHLPTVVDAISAYGEMALPHLDRLRELEHNADARRLGKRFNTRLREIVARLEETAVKEADIRQHVAD